MLFIYQPFVWRKNTAVYKKLHLAQVWSFHHYLLDLQIWNTQAKQMFGEEYSTASCIRYRIWLRVSDTQILSPLRCVDANSFIIPMHHSSHSSLQYFLRICVYESNPAKEATQVGAIFSLTLGLTLCPMVDARRMPSSSQDFNQGQGTCAHERKFAKIDATMGTCKYTLCPEEWETKRGTSTL